MKNILFAILLLIGATSLRAAESPLISQADSAYNADDFRQAADIYLNVIQQQGPSAKLYYNLGNTYYRLGEMGNAILSYERALRLDPSDDDVRNNLAFVNARITDRPGERGTFLGNALDAVSAYMHSNTWAWVAFSLFVITLVALMAYLFSNIIKVRKLGFFGGILTFMACCVSLYFSFRSAAIAMSDDAAIITVPSTILSTTPRVPQDRSQEAMLLHEGTKVKILDSVKSTTDSIHSLWYDVEVDNSHRAWINASAVEKI
ncbi:M48 family metallopeptidase [uncultured Duncaniella sp.]|uniref:tetratricopeptide repeat protein n=1 Tax=uncultured Duncaniella sp. TaxID=2768039 RepID=UPI0026774E55|nr:tetratricopeptide repeat protein [uncultured Duncaniella sp.]